MEIQNTVTIAALEQAFKASLAKAEKDCNWYKERIWRSRALSYLIRGITLIAVVLGIILPLTKKDTVDKFLVLFDGPAEAGYSFLLLAILVLAMDYVFMLSGTWARYINAMTKIETLISKAEYDWQRMKSGIASDGDAHEQREKAFNLFQKLVLDSRKVVEDETAAWGTELSQALQKLDSLVKEQRIAVETLYKEEKTARDEANKIESSTTTGGITVEIDKPEKLKGVLTMAVDDQTIERVVPIQKVVFPGVKAGQHAVVLKATDINGNAVWAEDLAFVEVNKIVNIKFMVPTG
ncbi:SLATT domain-containing protein [Candidatus Poribacteria bacterium]|nr:SLATT domain-containing protein [Candidatus Poribacteria bacterium]